MATNSSPVMPEELLPGLFRIEIPLSGSPLKSINSYVFHSLEGSLIIDTGMRRPECREALFRGLKNLNVSLKTARVMATHLHADHLGLIGELAEAGATIYLGTGDAAVLSAFANPEGFLQRLKMQGRGFGLETAEIERAVSRHPGLKYSPESYPAMHPIPTSFHINGYELHAVETPGHTPGHVCLWAQDEKFLISGDHILGDITPNITRWPGVEDSLGDYLRHLDLILDLGVRKAFPGHRSVIADVPGRILELKKHHQERLDEVLQILCSGPQSVCRIASRMSWDIRARSWKDFPPAQKWFACGEAAAHLDHLKCLGRVCSENNLWAPA